METKLTEETRVESDLIGAREIPASALYGVQTLRGIENFPISKFHLNEYPLFINGLAITKMAAAMANYELGLLTKEQKDAIVLACQEILNGEHHEQFPVDMIQGGAGTSTNMNANEVIANRALEIMGHKRGEYQYCSPNDHVNCSQSTNDAYPTAIHIGMYYSHLRFLPYLESLIGAFHKKGEEFAHIIKMGRTQLEDAVPMTLGQTFNGFASILRDEIRHLSKSDYIPCICWGRNARFAGKLQVGEHVAIWGRIQSREYQKRIDNDQVISKVAYEVSVSKMECLE